MINNIGNVKDILIKMLDPAEGAFKVKPDGKSAARIVAQVIDVKSDKAVLRWSGGRLTANTETPVYKGEHLLLEYYTQKGERSCYRILARSENVREESGVKNSIQMNPLPNSPESVLWSFLISFANQEIFYPVLLKFFTDEEGEDNNNPGKKNLLDLVVDTNNLGLVLIRMGLSGDGYFCNFLVESDETGEALEEGIRKILESEGAEIVPGKELLSWKVFPVKKEIANYITNMNISLDAHA